MNLRNITKWGVVDFIVYYVYSAPTSAAEAVKSAGSALSNFATSLSTFVNNVTASGAPVAPFSPVEEPEIDVDQMFARADAWEDAMFREPTGPSAADIAYREPVRSVTLDHGRDIGRDSLI